MDKPVSRQFEHDYYRYFNYPCYWGSSGPWGMGVYPNSLLAGGWAAVPVERFDEQRRDEHLRSAKEVTGYHIHGSDGTVGHAVDFIVDDETWALRYLVVDTAHWWATGAKVLVSPYWSTSISWANREIHVDLTRQAIKDSPKWDWTQSSIVRMKRAYTITTGNRSMGITTASPNGRVTAVAIAHRQYEGLVVELPLATPSANVTGAARRRDVREREEARPLRGHTSRTGRRLSDILALRPRQRTSLRSSIPRSARPCS